MTKITCLVLSGIISLAAVAHAAKTESFRSQYLAGSVSDTEIRMGEEEMGYALYGRLGPGTEKVKLGRLQTAYSGSETALLVDEVATEPRARGLGVATALHEFAVKREEKLNGVKIEKILATSYVDSNLDSVLDALINELRGEKGFVDPAHAKSATERLHVCCSNLGEAIKLKLAAAIENAPSMKIGRKLGYHLCPGSEELRLDRAKPYLNFEMCR